jgi:hypothetical protein
VGATLVVRPVLSLLFGLVSLLAPQSSLLLLVLLFLEMVPFIWRTHRLLEVSRPLPMPLMENIYVRATYKCRRSRVSLCAIFV